MQPDVISFDPEQELWAKIDTLATDLSHSSLEFGWTLDELAHCSGRFYASRRR
jgi:hypothetical protein